MTVSLEYLLKHIDNCPLSWHDGKIIVHKDTKQDDILAWLKKLSELNKYVKEQQLSLLDVRNGKRSIRTM
jgi:hypothetical protein